MIAICYIILICICLLQAEELAISNLKRALEALNAHLASNTYLVGHAVTLADIVMACNLYPGFTGVMTKSFSSQYPHVERYFWTIVNQPNFRKVMGEVKQTESIPPVPSKKPAQPKEAKPKEAKKEVKKEEPAKPKVEEAAVVEEEAPKPKPKNPLDLLPPSKMILDEWKRLYSNTKTNFREVALKGTLLFPYVLIFGFGTSCIMKRFQIEILADLEQF